VALAANVAAAANIDVDKSVGIKLVNVINHDAHSIAVGAFSDLGNEVVDDSAQRRRKEDRDYEPQNDGLPKLV
jgi:hypothetical protein